MSEPDPPSAKPSISEPNQPPPSEPASAQPPAAQTDVPPGATWIVAGGHAIDFVYSHEEMFEFDTAKYLKASAPHLVSHAETISHFAGRTGISPRLLIALMEMQSGVLSSPNAPLDSPFGRLSSVSGFIEQTEDVTTRLSRARYPEDPSGPRKVSTQTALSTLLTTDAELDALGEAYKRLFPGVVSKKKVHDPAPKQP